MKRTLAVVLLSSLILQGCAFAPGQHMTPDEVEDNGPDEPKVHLVAITPKSVQQQHISTKTSVLPPELLNYRTPEYVVGPGDTLLVTVFEHPELTAPGSLDQLDANSREVLSDGTVF